jgi:hypothetical protein
VRPPGDGPETAYRPPWRQRKITYGDPRVTGDVRTLTLATVSRAALPLTKIDVPCAATLFSSTNNFFLPSLCELIDDLFLQLGQKTRGISLGGGVENCQALKPRGLHLVNFQKFGSRWPRLEVAASNLRLELNRELSVFRSNCSRAL